MMPDNMPKMEIVISCSGCKHTRPVILPEVPMNVEEDPNSEVVNKDVMLLVCNCPKAGTASVVDGLAFKRCPWFEASPRHKKIVDDAWKQGGFQN